MDILGVVGYTWAIVQCMRLLPGGFCLMAPVCSTLVWISRSSVGRSYFQPLGNYEYYHCY